jgi:hypothetical protein
MPKLKGKVENASRREYTLDEKAKALAMLSLNKGNISRTAKETGIHFNTLRKWRDSTDPILVQKHAQEERNLSDLFEAEIYGIMQSLPLKRGEASYSQLAGGLTALFDRWKVLNGLPPEIAELIPHLVSASKAANIDLGQLLRSTLQRLNQVAEERVLKGLGVNNETIQDERLLEDSDTVSGDYEDVET